MYLSKPVFENRRNEFVVTLFNTLSKEEEKEDIEYSSLLDFCKTPRTRQEIMNFLNVTTVGYVTLKYIQPLIGAGKLKMTIPEKPKSKFQNITQNNNIWLAFSWPFYMTLLK